MITLWHLWLNRLYNRSTYMPWYEYGISFYISADRRSVYNLFNIIKLLSIFCSLSFPFFLLYFIELARFKKNSNISFSYRVTSSTLPCFSGTLDKVPCTHVHMLTLERSLFTRYKKNKAMFNWWPCILGWPSEDGEPRGPRGEPTEPRADHTKGFFYTRYLDFDCFFVC